MYNILIHKKLNIIYPVNYIGHHILIIQVNSFADTNKVLKFSRAFLTWQLVGIVAGVFDMCLKYANERKQFKMPLSSFQLIQEKLVRIGGNLQVI